jgi:hypothetical protein
VSAGPAEVTADRFGLSRLLASRDSHGDIVMAPPPASARSERHESDSTGRLLVADGTGDPQAGAHSCFLLRLYPLELGFSSLEPPSLCLDLLL